MSRLDLGREFGHDDDKFRIEECIGEGSQAKVFSCTRMKSGKAYAVKKVSIGTLEMQRRAGKVRVNLNREIHLMRQLTHPRIANLLGAYWEGDDLCFIVIDLARKGSLHDELVPGKGLRGPENASRHVAWQILEGLGYMHGKSVIHRDMKPANILITDAEKAEGEDGGLPYFILNVKISDFGLSRALNEAGGEKADMTSCGTPAFAAPEVTMLRYDEMADFWSYGCIIFTMLCGAYPFDDEPAHIRNPKKHSHGPAKIIDCDAWRNASEDGRSMVQSLLMYDPRERLGLDGCLKHAWLGKLPTVASSRFGRSPSGRLVKIPTAQTLGVFRKISGWVGEAVDRVELKFEDDTQEPLVLGLPTGGEQRKEWKLEADELVVAFRQEVRSQYLGNALVFFTSKCRVLALQGSDAARRRAFVAPEGSQIVGLQFIDGELIGIHLEGASGAGDARVEKIVGHVGYAVDYIHLCLRDGSVRKYGNKDGGDDTSETALEKDEYIVIVEQGPRDGYLGCSIAFYTSKMNVIALRGFESGKSRRYIAPPGKQICGFDVDENARSITSVKLCPASGDLTEESSSPCLEGAANQDGYCALM
eukprot:TRINITY_DN30704_c0_g1_i1.p1 TRINITY_DN30704_c0_g1~~TRINITY_DN30704_c0_g1_i1.p1  ORF type:complete len:589 (+),score=106.26 TRINITY_DN30704_c0_g1_i1:51-1817(+)